MLTIKQLFLSDIEANFSKSIGWTLGERTARYALIIDHGTVVYAEKEPGRDITVSTHILRTEASTDSCVRSHQLRPSLQNCRWCWIDFADTASRTTQDDLSSV